MSREGVAIHGNSPGKTEIQQLHQSVRADFIECLEEKRREDEYEARQDRALEEAGDEEPPSSS